MVLLKRYKEILLVFIQKFS